MTLTELSTAWNDLRNAALGRTATPNVPTALAAEVGTSYEQWRAYLASGPTWTAEVVPELASTWLERYRALASKVHVAVPGFAPASTGLLEQATNAIEQATNAIGEALKTVLIVVAAIGIPLLVLRALSGARR